jgi:hypothetical protein
VSSFRTSAVLASGILLAALYHRAAAQELEPGAYQNAPVAMNLVAIGYAFSNGNVLVDASLPVEGITAEVHTVVLGYVRTLSVLGLSAKFDAQMPLSRGSFKGEVSGEQRVRSPSGLADPRIRFAVNLLGAPALALPDFAKYRQRAILGANLQVVAPLGQYDHDRLINLGSNRWSFRTEIGVGQALRRWTFELAGGAWFFTENADFFGGSSLTQEPLYYVKGNLIYAFRRGLWLSLSAGHAEGGETQVNGVARNDLQSNNRVAASLALPIRRATALKLTYTNGLSTRLGADFNSIGASVQYSWGGGRRKQAQVAAQTGMQEGPIFAAARVSPSDDPASQPVLW